MIKAQTLTITFGPTIAKAGKVHSVRQSGDQVVMVCTGRVMAHLVPVAGDATVTCKSCAAQGA